MSRAHWFVPIALAMFLGGCSAMQPKDFEGTEPRLDLFDYFGYGLATDGTTIVVGAPRESGSGSGMVTLPVTDNGTGG